MAKKNFLPGLPRVQKAIKKAGFTLTEFSKATSAFAKLGASIDDFKRIKISNDGKEK